MSKFARVANLCVLKDVVLSETADLGKRWISRVHFDFRA